MSNKPYTWEEIKEFLVKELNKTNSIMTFGTIGSCNVEHDVDVIITKKPNFLSKDFFKELHYILDTLDVFLYKKYKARLIRVPNISYTLEFMELSKYSKNDFVLHTMVYSSYPQMKKDWGWALFEGEDIKEILKNYDCFFGSIISLFSKEFGKSNYADNIFLYLTLYDRTNSKYPKAFLVKIMKYYLNFLFKKRLNMDLPVIKNYSDIRKGIYQLAEILDDLNKRHD